MKTKRKRLNNMTHLPFDVEAMIEACLPGGNSCDPQQVADAIREYCRVLPNMASTATHLRRRDLAPSGQIERLMHLRTRREMRVYVAGPMTGLPDFNFPAFNAVAERLSSQGMHVENPAQHGHVEGASWADYLRYDLSRLVTCSVIHLLPGWSKSRGATLELYVAFTLGLEVQYAEGAERLEGSSALISDQDCGLMEQASRMLEELGEELRGRGNDSAAAGAENSAHAIRRLTVQARCATAQTASSGGPKLGVLFDSMPESNGRSNWTVVLHRAKDSGLDMFSNGVQVHRSESYGQARYQADRLRFLIGDIPDRPDILEYDSGLSEGMRA